MVHRAFVLLVSLLCVCAGARGEPVVLDDFSSIDGWVVGPSDGVSGKLERLDLPEGKHAMRLHFSFDSGSGYCVVRKPVKLDLPANYRFTFDMRAHTPVNNFEVKLVDAGDENVWWVNTKAFEYPGDWARMQYRARHFQFAWGPSGGKKIEKLGYLEFVVTAWDGGKGWVDFADLRYEALPESKPPTRRPGVRADLNAYGGRDGKDGETTMIFQCDEINEDGTLRMPVFKRTTLFAPHLVRVDVDLREARELGGLILDWDREDYPTEYDVLATSDGKTYDKIGEVRGGLGGRRYLPIKDGEARKVRLDITKTSRGLGVKLDRVEVADTAFSATMSAAWSRVSSDERRGLYPRWTRREQGYWTVAGVGGDTKESLLSADGVIETDKLGFSVEPMVKVKGMSRVQTWADAESAASLEEGDLPIPSTTLTYRDAPLTLKVTALADGPAGKSVLLARYVLTNTGAEAVSGELALGLRPFQVLPPWQELNITGGAARVSYARVLTDADVPLIQMGERVVRFLTPRGGGGWSAAGAMGVSDFVGGDALARWALGAAPLLTQVTDELRACSGYATYPFELAPGASDTFVIGWAFHDEMQNIEAPIVEGLSASSVAAHFEQRLAAARMSWRAEVSKVGLTLPPSGKRLTDTFRVQQGYILINRDGPAIQPGSRTYERSWIRDGSLTGTALMTTGHIDEARQFVDWYAPYQFANGKVPCVVDRRGPDPVAENDSHGQLIFAIASVYRYTGDTGFLERHLAHVEKAVAYIESLRAQRMSEEYKSGSPQKRALYGLVTESISHEGYSAKPMHSYWDGFFTIRGLKDAVFIAERLNRPDLAEKWSKLRDEYREATWASMKQAMANAKIDYIPGCAELGDFDATSTTVGVWPADEVGSIPEPQLHRTFDKWFEFFRNRRDAKIEWKDYTPYELRMVGCFVRLGQPDRAWELLDFYFNDQRPAGWLHWGEVVHRDPKFPGYIGDMPHTWVGSDFVNSARAMFVHEHGDHLVLAAGVKPQWLSEKDADGVVRGVRVEGFPTELGRVSYTMTAREDGSMMLEFQQGIFPGPGRVEVHVPGGRRVTCATFNGRDISADAIKGSSVFLDGSAGTLIVR